MALRVPALLRSRLSQVYLCLSPFISTLAIWSSSGLFHPCGHLNLPSLKAQQTVQGKQCVFERGIVLRASSRNGASMTRKSNERCDEISTRQYCLQSTLTLFTLLIQVPVFIVNDSSLLTILKKTIGSYCEAAV